MSREKRALPESECDVLRTLAHKPSELRARVRLLYAQGWSLAAIGEALTPPRPRSTVRSWLTAAPPSLSTPPSPSSSSSSDSPITAAESCPSPPPPPAPPPPPPPVPPAPSPLSSASAAPSPRTERRYYDPHSPDLSITAAQKIRSLAPLARRHRANTSSTSPYALANHELTVICREEYARGVSVRELAATAGVTYKAMERRVRPQ